MMAPDGGVIEILYRAAATLGSRVKAHRAPIWPRGLLGVTATEAAAQVPKAKRKNRNAATRRFGPSN